jgi:hypothetical protein
MHMPLSQMGVHQASWLKNQLQHGAATNTTLFPRSHKFQAQFSLSQRATKIMAFKENYQQLVNKDANGSRSGFPNG